MAVVIFWCLRLFFSYRVTLENNAVIVVCLLQWAWASLSLDFSPDFLVMHLSLACGDFSSASINWLCCRWMLQLLLDRFCTVPLSSACLQSQTWNTPIWPTCCFSLGLNPLTPLLILLKPFQNTFFRDISLLLLSVYAVAWTMAASDWSVACMRSRLILIG